MSTPLPPFDLPLDQQPHDLAGRLVVVDGVDGSGKSTLAAAVADWLQKSGRPARAMDLMSSWVRKHPQFQLLADDLDAVVTGRADIGGLCAMCIGDRLATWRTAARRLVADGTWLVVDPDHRTPRAGRPPRGAPQEDPRQVKALLERLPRPDLGLLADCPPDLTVDRVRRRPDEAHKTQRRLLAEGLVDAFRAYAPIHDVDLVDTSGPVDAALEAAIPSLRRLIDAS